MPAANSARYAPVASRDAAEPLPDPSRCTIAHAMLAEFERESVATRKFLERIPDDRLGWRPHPRSMTVGQLAMHIAQSPAGALGMSLAAEAPVPDLSVMPQAGSAREAVQAYDQSAAFVRDALPALTDARMAETFTVTSEGRPVLVMPRAQFLRSILLNHTYHHRGQMGVFLRLLGFPVPSAYGPSGDESPM